MSMMTGSLIHRPIIITIRGCVSSGKSLWAARLREVVDRVGYRAAVSDSMLFSFRESYRRDFQATIDRFIREDVDVGIVVVGTGHNNGEPFVIEISPQITAPMDVLSLLSGSLSHRDLMEL